MEQEEYNEKLFCFWCSYASMYNKYVLALKSGDLCECKYEVLKEAASLLDQFTAYEPGITTTWSDEDFLKLVYRLEKLLE
jgi:exonuclease V gamma subunit